MFEKEEVALRVVLDVGHAPLVDEVGVGDDVGAGGLSEDFCQHGDGDRLRLDHVFEDVAWADTCELVDVAD